MGTTTSPARPFGFAIFSVIAGVIGWFASFELITERINTLVDPQHVPNCNISIVVSCGPNMGSWQGSIFGFSNPILGIAMFVAPIILGVALLAGAQFASWFWRLYLVGITFAFGFVAWLISQSIYSLGTLCPWCMVCWAVVIPLFWYTWLFVAKQGHLGLSERGRELASTLYSWAWIITLGCYLIVAIIAQVRLDWISEIGRMFS
ncbi:vitamin K epoxide reductase family protein [Lysinibacter cavernae]|uniref:Putative membrane protein n=1 Tax=Lysinibacter cavernae TaxID=1640652 RepID=A0A7X5TTK2_9MICO|nr:vitamin K epoxide reductase family protein [Lysinibacter cavernae]NIH52732.1 putative membrane protein [Lysinibacter cavernae]